MKIDIKDPILGLEGYIHTLEYIRSKGFDFQEFSLDKNFFKKARQVMVDYILHESKSFASSNQRDWDFRYLPNLVLWLPKFLTFNQNNFKTLIEGSIEDNLVEKLSSSPLYGSYTTSVLDEMEKLDIDVDLWLNDSNPVKVKSSSFTFEPWKRDFRKEYAIGSYSRCCVGLGEFSDYSYPPVLLEYFLDVSIKTIIIKDQDDKQFAQSYLLAAKNQKNEPVLVVTTIEHYLDEEHSNYLIEPLVKSHLEQEGFQQRYGFKHTFFYSRKKEFQNFNKYKKNQINKDVKQLKSIRDQKSSRKRSFKSRGLHEQKRHTAKQIAVIRENLESNKKLIESLRERAIYF